jgi:hypothetical protein
MYSSPDEAKPHKARREAALHPACAQHQIVQNKNSFRIFPRENVRRCALVRAKAQFRPGGGELTVSPAALIASARLFDNSPLIVASECNKMQPAATTKKNAPIAPRVTFASAHS